MTHDKFDPLFLGLCVTYRQKENVKELYKVYFNTLNVVGFTDEDMKIACDIVLAKNTFMPKPAELIEAIEPRLNARVRKQREQQQESEEFSKIPIPDEAKEALDKLLGRDWRIK